MHNMVEQKDPLTLIPGAPDPIGSPELYQACRNGLNTVARLSGFSESETAMHISSYAERLKRLHDQEMTAPNLLIARLALLPTTLAYSGTERDLLEVKQKAFEAISQISTARDRASILK